VYFGSTQVDYVRGARTLGIPSMLCVGSWDHLTTKGLVHAVPNRVTVWNDVQRREAQELHGIGPEQVTVTGAQAYDHWFVSKPSLSREAFCLQVGLPADRPLLLYLCSSPFIAPYEVGFVRRWIEAIRHAPDARLREVALLVRPHPQNADQWRGVDLSSYGAVAVWPALGANPVDRDARADYFNSMYYSAAVVGVNTSALIESGIVGRPVHTIVTEEFQSTQEGTLHFRHLENVNGGLLQIARDFDEHLAQVGDVLAGDTCFEVRSRGFVEAFIRPCGLDRPAAEIFADTVEQVARLERLEPVPTSIVQYALRPLLYPLAIVAQIGARRAREAARREKAEAAERMTTADRDRITAGSAR
jgi:hypothetical protein